MGLRKSPFGLALVLTSLLISCQGRNVPCPALPLRPGIVISCFYPKEDFRKIPCTGPISGVPKRSVGKYKCEGDADFEEKILECKCFGKWKGLEEFNSKSESCQTVQHGFSLSGPSELNLTMSEVEDFGGTIKRGNSTEQYAQKYEIEALAYHNFYRRKHGAPPLKLNQNLSGYAAAWAEKEAGLGALSSEPISPNKTYLSNSYLLMVPGSEAFDPSVAVKLAVARWYGSGSDYDFELPVPNAFSAMLWNSSSDLGVGVGRSREGRMVVVCNYSPPGNVYLAGGENGLESLALFKRNVFSRIGKLPSQ